MAESVLVRGRILCLFCLSMLGPHLAWTCVVPVCPTTVSVSSCVHNHAVSGAIHPLWISHRSLSPEGRRVFCGFISFSSRRWLISFLTSSLIELSFSSMLLSFYVFVYFLWFLLLLHPVLFHPDPTENRMWIQFSFICWDFVSVLVGAFQRNRTDRMIHTGFIRVAYGLLSNSSNNGCLLTKSLRIQSFSP